MSIAGEGTGTDRTLLRISKTTEQFITREGLPTRCLFEPSTKDMDNPPVRVSVWDPEVVPFRRAASLLPDGDPRWGWTILESEVMSVSDVEQTAGRAALAVVQDPDGTPEGADLTTSEKSAHYGIEGLLKPDRLPKSQQAACKNVLRLLASKAKGPITE